MCGMLDGMAQMWAGNKSCVAALQWMPCRSMPASPTSFTLLQNVPCPAQATHLPKVEPSKHAGQKHRHHTAAIERAARHATSAIPGSSMVVMGASLGGVVACACVRACVRVCVFECLCVRKNPHVAGLLQLTVHYCDFNLAAHMAYQSAKA